MTRFVVVVLALAACSEAKGPTEQDARDAYRARLEKVDAFNAWVESVNINPEKLGELGQALSTRIEREVDAAGAVGADITIVDASNNHQIGGASVGACSVHDKSGKKGNVRVGDADAVRFGSRTIGYGLYQTAYSVNGVDHGDGAWHPGIHVRSRTLRVSFKIETMLCFLTDGTPRPK